VKRPVSELARRGVVAGVAAVAVLALVGVVVFWPSGDAPSLGVTARNLVDAKVTSVEQSTCLSVEVPEATEDCQRVEARLSDGSVVFFVVLATDTRIPELDEGDRVVLFESPSSPSEFRYSFVDFQRGPPLLLLALVFAVVVILLGRWQGVRALAGLVVSGLVLVGFLVPSLLRDSPAVLVALTAAAVIAFAAIYLAHGVNMASSVALVSTLVSLAMITLLAVVVVSAARITGISDESAQVLRITASAVDLRGLLIAGIVIGALGALDDVTVSQVSTVGALRRADPSMPAGRLYQEASRVGRDHVASTVNTLVLTYAGAALPLLLLFAQGDQSVLRVLSGEIVAIEIVRTLVGSIGLVLSVPIATLLAAHVLRPSDEGTGQHVH
jgi:uncharacterized membrane protein